MNKMKTVALGVLAASFFAALLACEQPFKAGLGPVVDAQPPTVTLKHVVLQNQSIKYVGENIGGKAIFVGEAKDDYKLDSVYFKITNNPKLKDPNSTEGKKYFSWYRIDDPATKGSRALHEAFFTNNGDWQLQIDTNLFEDGDLLIKLKIIDSVQKEAETDDIAFYLKNEPPAVSLGFPAVFEGKDDGQLGSPHLNWNDNHMVDQTFPRKVDPEGSVSGLIIDKNDIEWAEYRLWEVTTPQTVPNVTAEPWKKFVLNKNLNRTGVDTYSFDIDLEAEGVKADSSYALQIRVLSKDTSTFNYPQDFWTKAEQAKWTTPENRYVLMFTRANTVPPVLALYALQDLKGAHTGTFLTGDGPVYTADISPLAENYPYVNETNVSKGGPFTLRVKATHAEGIAQTVVYWERAEGGAQSRGRFEWDTLNVGDPGAPPRFDSTSKDLFVDGTRYTWRGYNDEFSSTGVNYAIKSFIFTYRDAATNSNVKVFNGSNDAWDNKFNLDANGLFNGFDATDGNWANLTGTLPAGTYNLKIVTVSNSGSKTPRNTELQCSITIDRTPPAIELNDIFGNAGTEQVVNAGVTETRYIVNGVVRPRLNFNETGTGLRTASLAYFAGTYEQRFFVVSAANKSKMDASLPANFWPPVPATATTAHDLFGTLASGDILAHGSVVSNEFKMRTSPYASGDTPNTDYSSNLIPDGDYYIYVLARDNAFNVGRQSFPIRVAANTDIPTFDFTVGDIKVGQIDGVDVPGGVTNPNESADGTGGNGFIVKNAAGAITARRNILTSSSKMIFNIKDDDSLDLGTTTDNSTVVVTIQGAQTDASGDVVLNDTDLPKLTLTDQALIKGAFLPQGGAGTARLAVKDRRVELTQQALLGLLKASSNYNSFFGVVSSDSTADITNKKNAFNSLPSGIYQITVTIQDYNAVNTPEIKLTMTPGASPADSRKSTAMFWVAVDTTPPVGEITGIAEGTSTYISAIDNVHIKGWVADQNGPLNLKSITVSPTRQGGTQDVLLDAVNNARFDRRTTTTTPPLDPSLPGYQVDFQAMVNLRGNSGTFEFTLTFQDRFGNERILKKSFQADVQPPTAGLSGMISTFERDMADVIVTPATNPADNNKLRLTNGVVSFRVSAADNTKVESVRWWLQQASAAAPTYADNSITTINATDNFVSAPTTTSAYGYKGSSVLSGGNYTVFVDTRTFADGEYNLYVMARDDAGNISVSSTALQQTVYVLQVEDRPYFDAAITPNHEYEADGTTIKKAAVVGETDLVISGMIYEDDGWDATPVIQLYYANSVVTPPAATADTITGFAGSVTITSGLTVTGKNLKLSINLKDYPAIDNAFRTGGVATGAYIDGAKSMVIRATDSVTASTPAGYASGVPGFTSVLLPQSRNKYISFILDTKNPEINITNPAKGTVFGANASDPSTGFNLVGTISDENLDKDADGNYYILIWCDGWGNNNYIPIPLGKAVSTVPDPSYITAISGNVVSFDIPSAAFAAAGMLNFTPLGAGYRVLTVKAKDGSGKEGSFTLNFIKDMDKPKLSLVGMDEATQTSAATWASLTGKARHDWLFTTNATKNLVVDSSKRVLSVLIEDVYSNIDDASFKYWFDNETTARTTADGDATWPAIIGKAATVAIKLPDSTVLPDGAHIVRFEVADKAGNILETACYAFVLDGDTPANFITVKGNDTGTTALPSGTVLGLASTATGVLFNISGKTLDANLKDVTFRIARTDNGNQLYPTAAAGVTSSISLVTSTDPRITPTAVNNRWSFYPANDTITVPSVPPDPSTVQYPTMTKEELEWTFAFRRDLAPNITLATTPTSYDVIVEATDQLGNVSEQWKWTFIFTQDKPAIEFGNSLIENTANGLLPAAATFNGTTVNGTIVNVISGTNAAIQGMASDSYSALDGLQYQLDMFDYSTGAWPTTSTWVDMPSFVAGASLQFPWRVPVTTGEGFYRIRVQAKNSAWNANSATPGADGIYPANGPGNPVLSRYVYFFYDTGTPDLQPDATSAYFSSRKEGGNLVLTGKSIDPNRLRSVTASVTVGYSTAPVSAALTGTWAPPALNTQALDTANWTISLPMPFLQDILDVASPPPNQRYVLDGNYVLKLKAIDLANKETEIDIPITLDNKRPTGVVTSPEYVSDAYKAPNYAPSPPPPPASNTVYPYQSIVVQGGEPTTITGETEDSGLDRSESGVKAIYYHLGYIDGDPLWPTPQKLWAAAGVPTGQVDSGNHSKKFDDLANAATDNAWFKLGGTQVPPGFKVENSNVFDWRIVVDGVTPATPSTDGFKIYADINKPLTLKGRTYDANNNTGATGTPDNGTTIKLVERVSGSQTDFHMPLWFRVEDEVGNVNYFCQDIRIYPDGDIPKVGIVNPADAESGAARGGTITADGTATNISSVYAVIYRVKVDNGRLATDVEQANSKILELKNGTFTGRDKALIIAALPADYQNQPDNWYLVTNDRDWGDALVPWNFTINTQGEINAEIATLGFRAAGAGGTPDTIRVRIEMFAFKGAGTTPDAPTVVSTGPGSITNPLPDVRTFFLNQSAPVINTPMISPSNQTTFAAYSSRVVRRGSFAVRANLQASATGQTGRSISRISVRRVNESAGNTGWVDAWERTSTTAALTNNVPGFAITASTGTGAALNPTQFTYTLDSKSAQVRNNEWANSGGSYRIEVRIRDNATPAGEAFQTFEVGIDNFVPVADPGVTTNKKAAGTAVAFIGRALDYSGSPTGAPAISPDDRKVNKVYAWFTKEINSVTNYVNMKEKDLWRTEASFTTTGAGATAGEVMAYKDRVITLGGTGDNADRVVTVTAAGTSEDQKYPLDDMDSTRWLGWAMELSQATAMPGSGISWVPNGDQDIKWSFNVNTLNLPDGPITLNYLVYDEAGNASFYQQKNILIMNRYPVIDRVTLHTDNTGVGAVYTTDFDTMNGNIGSSSFAVNRADNTAGYLNSGFISKNRFIGFEVRTISGNAPLNYQVQYVTRKKVPLTTANLNAMIALKGGSATPGGQLDPGTINLFTIAVNDETNPGLGNYGNNVNTWSQIGVHADAIIPGLHFVFDADSLTGITQTPATGTEATMVWAYTPVIQKDPIYSGSADNAGYEDPQRRFSFYNQTGNGTFPTAADFPDGSATSQAGRIGVATGSHPGEPGDNPFTTAFFLIKVWDSVDTASGVTAGSGEFNQLYDAVVVGMNVYLEDTAPPTSRLYDLNPYAEQAVSGNNITDANRRDTITNAAAPRGIGQNILRGGLFNINTSTELVKSGHIEPRGGTTALTPSFFNPGADPASLTLTANDRFTNRAADGYWAGDPSLDPNHPDRNADSPASTFPVDQVSGRIILRGIAWDNQLIQEVQLYIGTSTAPADANYVPILRRATTAPVKMEAVTAGGYTQPVHVREELHWKNGHTVEWAYVWDTTKTLANADTYDTGSMNIFVRVRDAQGTSGGLYSGTVQLGDGSTAGSELETANVALAIDDKNKKFHNTINVNVVPYITGFQRQAKFASSRSRQGWYSFYQGETGVKALGYNLLSSAAGTNTGVRLNTSAAAAGTAPAVTARSRPARNASDYTSFMDQVTFTVPNNAASGQLDLYIGATYTPTGTTANNALNHRTVHDGKSWNRETWKFTDGSDLWINKPHAHVWRSNQVTGANTPYTYMSTVADSAGLNSPGMALEYTGTNAGRLHGAWSTYGRAGYFYGYNTNAGRTTLTDNDTEPYSETDISLYNGTGVPNVVVAYQGDGVPVVRLRTVMNNATGTNIFTNTGGANNNNNPTERWRNLRVAKAEANFDTTNNEGRAGRVYLTGWDAYNDSLRFGRHAIGSFTATIDGTGANITATGATAVASAGEFSAVDYDSTGPVIAYYDRTNDTARIVFGTENYANGTAIGQTYTANANSNDYANTTRYFQATTNNANPGLAVGDIVRLSGTPTVDRYVLWIGTNGTGNALRYRIKVSAGTTGTDATTVWPANNTTVNTQTITPRVFSYTWARRALLPASNPLYKGSGKYISMKVDKDNRVHLAFYNSIHQTVVYANLTRATTTANGVDEVYTVDNVVKNGTWTDISVDNNGMPWITYGDTARTGNNDGARMAYKTNNTTTHFSGRYVKCPVTGENISDWETLTMPTADYKVFDDRLNIEAWPPTARGGTVATTGPGWNAAVGYASDSFRIAYFYCPAWKSY